MKYVAGDINRFKIITRELKHTLKKKNFVCFTMASQVLLISYLLTPLDHREFTRANKGLSRAYKMARCSLCFRAVQTKIFAAFRKPTRRGGPRRGGGGGGARPGGRGGGAPHADHASRPFPAAPAGANLRRGKTQVSHVCMNIVCITFGHDATRSISNIKRWMFLCNPVFKEEREWIRITVGNRFS